MREICGTYAAFAAILDDGTLVTWGDVRCGGDSDAIQDQLLGRPIRSVKASLGAFAARTQDYAKLHIRVASTKVKIKGDFVAQMISAN